MGSLSQYKCAFILCGILGMVHSSGTDAPALSGDTFTVTWDSVAGMRYQLQYKDALNDPSWTDVASPVTATGSGNKTSTDNTTVAGQPQRFYRVAVVP